MRSFEQEEGVFLKENSVFLDIDVFNCKQKMQVTFIPSTSNSYLRNLAEFQGSESEVNNPSSCTKKTKKMGKEVA